MICFIALLLNLSVFANAQASDTRIWIDRTDENGSIYLENTQNGEKMLEAFCIDAFGNTIELDLLEYINELNNAVIIDTAETSTGSDSFTALAINNPIIITPHTTAEYEYVYTQTSSYVGVGNAEKVTPDVVGPATVSYGNTITVSESFGGGLNLTVNLKKKISAGASFNWNISLSTNTSFGVSYNVPAGKTGYIQFKPRLDVTKGHLYEKFYFNGALQSTTDMGECWGACPKKLSSGFADGTYELILK